MADENPYRDVAKEADLAPVFALALSNTATHDLEVAPAVVQDLVPVLVNVMYEGASPRAAIAAVVLEHVVCDDAKLSTVIETLGVNPLLELIGQERHRHVVNALAALGRLATAGDWVDLIASAAVLCVLVPKCCEGDRTIRKLAVLTVRQIASATPDRFWEAICDDSVVRAKSVALLAALVACGSDFEKEKAAAALSRVGDSNSQYTRVLQRQDVEALTKLLSSEQESHRTAACEAMRAMFRVDLNYPSFIWDEPVACVVSLTRDGSDTEKSAALRALSSFLTVLEVGDVVAELGGITILIDVIQTDKDTAVLNALRALHTHLLCRNESSELLTVVDSARMELLIHILASGPDEQKLVILDMFFATLIDHPQVRGRAKGPKLVAAALVCLRSQSRDVVRHAMRLLRLIPSYHSSDVVVDAIGDLDALLDKELLTVDGEEDLEFLDSAKEVIRSAVEVRCTGLSSVLLERLVDMACGTNIEHTSSALQTQALDCLRNLTAENKDGEAKPMWQSLFCALRGQLEGSASDETLSAVDFVCFLLGARDVDRELVQLVSSGVIKSLVRVSTEGSADIVPLADQALTLAIDHKRVGDVVVNDLSVDELLTLGSQKPWAREALCKWVTRNGGGLIYNLAASLRSDWNQDSVPQPIRDACGAAWLCLSSPTSAAKIAAIPTLIPTLVRHTEQDQDDPSIGTVAMVLADIAATNAYHPELTEAGGIKIVVDGIRLGMVQKERAIDAITTVAGRSENDRVELVNVGAVGVLIEILRVGGEVEQMSAVAAVMELSPCRAAMRAFNLFDGAEALEKLVAEGSFKCRQIARKALDRIKSNSDGTAEDEKSDEIRAIVDWMARFDEVDFSYEEEEEEEAGEEIVDAENDESPPQGENEDED